MSSGRGDGLLSFLGGRPIGVRVMCGIEFNPRLVPMTKVLDFQELPRVIEDRLLALEKPGLFDDGLGE